MLNIKLKELRKKRGLTQEQLALIIGVERSSVGKYESPTKPVIPSSDILINLSIFFGVTVDYLLGRDDNKKAPPQLSEGAKAMSELENAQANQIMDLVSRLDENQLKIAREYLDFLLMKQEQKENQ